MGSLRRNTNTSVTASDGVGSETFTYSLSGPDTTALTNIGLAIDSVPTGQITGTATVGAMTITVDAVGNTSGITGSMQITITIT